MKHIYTAYPCYLCDKEISPSDDYCRFCGAKQPDVGTRTQYNVFYRRKGAEAFGVMYDGDPILTLDDVLECFYDEGHNHNRSDYFAGSYTQDKTGFIEGEMQVTSWRPLGKVEMGADLGEQRITISLLE